MLTTLIAVNCAASELECPQVMAIQKVGLNQVNLDAKHSWTASYQPFHQYDTNEKWTFIIGNDGPNNKAATKDEAMSKASTGLQTLSYLQGPIYGGGFKICHYATKLKGVEAAAITPPIGR